MPTRSLRRVPATATRVRSSDQLERRPKEPERAPAVDPLAETVLEEDAELVQAEEGPAAESSAESVPAAEGEAEDEVDPRVQAVETHLERVYGERLQDPLVAGIAAAAREVLLERAGVTS